MKESAIQKAVVGYARDRNLIAIKLSTVGIRGTAGWPDYIFLGPNRSVMFIEFKQRGKQLTPLQAQRCALLEPRAGFCPLVADDVKGGKLLVDSFLRAARRRRASSLGSWQRRGQ